MRVLRGMGREATEVHRRTIIAGLDSPMGDGEVPVLNTVPRIMNLRVPFDFALPSVCCQLLVPCFFEF